jgi:hypothetical protein
MKPFTKIKEFLNQRPNQYIPSTMVFNELDLDVMGQQLQLKEKAQQRGAAELPNTNSIDLDTVETEIVNSIEAEKNKYHETLRHELQAYDNRIAALSLDNKVFDIKNAAENAKAEFEAEARDGTNQLELDLQVVKEIDQERKAFKKRNKLTRTAHYPESHIYHWGIISLLFLVECILNANFFANGLENGLLGGFIEALGITFVNISVGLSVGALIYPQVNHIKIRWRMFGWLAILLYASCAISFNLLVAHYRTALGGNAPDLAGTSAVLSFLSNPFALKEFHAWMMVGIGLIFSVIASVDAFKMNDRYPGYSKIEKKYVSALQNYTEHYAEIIDNLRDIKDIAIESIRSSKKSFSEQRSEFDNIIVHRQGVLNAFAQRIPYLQNCAKYLINLYRETNVASRTSEAPSYFNTPVILESSHPIEAASLHAKEQNNLDATALSIYKNLDEITEGMHSEFTSIQKRFPLLDELLGEKIS